MEEETTTIVYCTKIQYSPPHPSDLVLKYTRNRSSIFANRIPISLSRKESSRKTRNLSSAFYLVAVEIVVTDSLGTLFFRVSQVKPSLQKLLGIGFNEVFTGFSFLISHLQNLIIAIISCNSWIMLKWLKCTKKITCELRSTFQFFF